MRRVWAGLLVAALASGGCSFGMRSPYGAKHQGQCDTSRNPPTVDAAMAGTLGLVSYFVSTEDCGSAYCGSGAIGGVMIIGAVVYAIASIKGFSKSSWCRELPPAPDADAQRSMVSRTGV